MSEASELAAKLEDKIRDLEAEVERLQEIIRAGDTASGNVRARFERKSGGVIVTCPSADERTIAMHVFAAIAAWSYTSAISAVCTVVGEERGEAAFKDMIEDVIGKKEDQAQ